MRRKIQILSATFALFFAFPINALQGVELKIEIDSSLIDRDQEFMPHSYAAILDKATPSIVSVYTARIVRVARSRGYSSEEELLRRFFGIPIPRGEPSEEPEERKLPQGVGSGIIISQNGYIVTNNHVVSNERGNDADEILVRLTDGLELEAKIVGRDPLADIAILKIDAENLPVIKIADSDNIKVGDVVFAIGNPMSVGLTVTQGIVSATNRSIGIYGDTGYEDFIQTDASINPGNSGGALIDSQGRLIGVNSAILSRSGGNIGIGFAIPSNLALNISAQLVDIGEVRRGFLGVSISDLSPDMAEAFDLKDIKGVLINDIEDGSAADRGGMKRGDIIVELNGKPVDSANDLRIRIGHTLPGTEIKIEVIRDKKRKRLEIEVGQASGQFFISANELFKGVEIAPLDDENIAQYRIPENIGGLLITSVAQDSPYARTFHTGMLIIEVNDTPVQSIRGAQDCIRPGINKLYIYNRGRTAYIAIRVD